MRKFVAVVVCLMLLLGVLPVFAQDAEMAQIRVGHFSPGLGDVDVYIDGELSDGQEMAFGEVSEWLAIAPGSHSVAVTSTGAGEDEALVSGDLELEAGEWVTAVAIGEESHGTLALHPVVEDHSPIGVGETRLTFLNVIPDVGAVNVQLADGTMLVDTLFYPEVGSTDEFAPDGYATVELLEGQRTVEIIPVDSETALASLDEAIFASLSNNLIVIAGLRANPIVRWVGTEADGMMVGMEEEIDVGEGPAMVRVGHFLTGVTEDVDLYINGELSEYVGLSLGDISDWFEVPSGYYDLAVAPTETSLAEAIVVSEDVPVVADQHTTLAAIGAIELDGGMFYPVVEDYSPITFGETRLAFLNAVQDMDPVNVQLADGTLLMMTVAYPGLPGAISYDSVDILAGDRDIQIVSSADATAVISDLPGTTLSNGSNNLIVLTGLRDAPVTFHEVTK